MKYAKAEKIVYTICGIIGIFLFSHAYNGGFDEPPRVPRIHGFALSENIKDETESGDLRIKGNKISKIYHLPGCANYNDIAGRNVVWFKTKEKAMSEGFRMAKNC